MSERQVLTLRSPSGAAFDAALGAVLAETPSTLLIDGERVSASGGTELPARVVIKRGKQPADFGRLDLEQVACERLEHPGLARYFGAARTPELGTVLAFERLGGSPLLLFNAQGTRPSFRDPGTVHYPLPPGVALELAFDALLALEHVHSRGFVHGGVTVTNLLVRTQTPPADPADLLTQVSAGGFHGVLGGLGGARELTFLEALRDGLVDPDLTPRLPDVYASPEALLELSHLGGRRVYSQAMDMYAFGLLTYTLLTGHAPYDHVCAPHELTHRDVVTELKLRESRGDLSPILVDALRDLPLHDSPFVGPTIEAWPTFHSAVRHLLARCLDRDPARRLDATAAKELFCSALELRPSPVERVRPWIQGTFQLLSSSNRLRGDRPGAGLTVRQEEGGDLIVEVRDAPPASPEPHEVLTNPELDPSLSIAFRAAKPPPAPTRKRRIAPPVPLREVARAFHAKEPLPVQSPFLLTSTSLDKDSLARTVVHSLGSVVSWVVVADGGVQEQLRLIVGRTPENDIVCPDGKVSKKHAALGFDRVSGHWYVEDLRSANGTRVDGRDAPPNVKTRLRKAPAVIDVGTGVELTYMETPQLLDFLAIVVEAVKRAAEAAKRAAVTDLLDEAWQGEPEQAPPPQVARTRRLQRPTAGNTTVKFPVARVAPQRADWDGLARRLQPHAEAGASFRIVLTGSIVEHAASVPEAISMLKEAGAGLVSLEAEFPDHRILIFARPDPKSP